MDTQTVLDIIVMIDAKINHTKLNQPVPIQSDWYNGLVWGLEEFRDHLQECIEQLVNQAENNLNAGE